MGDSVYIDRDAALAVFGDIHPLDYNAQEYYSRLKAIPAADVRSVKRGKWDMWYPKEWIVRCSNCKSFMRESTPFCPNCGAEML